MSSDYDIWFDAEESFSDESYAQEDSPLFDNMSQIAKEALAEGEEATDLLERLIQMRISYLEHLNTGGRARAEWIPLENNDASVDPAVIREDEVRCSMRDAKHVFHSLVGAFNSACRAVEEGDEKVRFWKAVENANFTVTFLNERLNEVDDEIEEIETAERRERRLICGPKRPSKIASLWETIARPLIGY